MANILVVQDVEENIVDIKLSLEPGGHQLLIAHTVESAMTLLKATSFDLLICGVHLQNSTVFDLLKFVKNDPERRSMPYVFFCTSTKDIAKYVSETVRSTAMLLGADKYITQEVFDARLFRAEIESLIPGSREPVEIRRI
jgi:CheY-like chemotaxis protein